MICSLKSFLFSSSVACLTSLALVGGSACDLAPTPMEFRAGSTPFEVYDVLDNYAATPEAGPAAVVAAEAEIQTLDTAALVYAMNDEYSDDPTPADYMAEVAAMFPGNPEIVSAYNAMYYATSAEQRRAIMLELLCNPDYHLASPIIRSAVSTMEVAGLTKLQIKNLFATATQDRIKLVFAPPGEQDGVVAVHELAPVAAGTAVEVWIYGNVNNVTNETLTQSQASEDGGDGGGDGNPDPTGGDPTAGDTADPTTASTTVESTTVNSTTESTTINTTTESTTVNTTVESNTTVVITTVNTTSGGGGGGGGFDLFDFLWDVFQGAAAGGTLGTIAGTGFGNPAAGGAVGAGVGAAAGAAYYFGSGFMADPACDRMPWILC